jgi:hypothetical protein
LECPLLKSPKLDLGNDNKSDAISLKLGDTFTTKFDLKATQIGTPLTLKIDYPAGSLALSASLDKYTHITAIEDKIITNTFNFNGYVKTSPQPYLYRVVERDNTCTTLNSDTLKIWIVISDSVSKPSLMVKDIMIDNMSKSLNEDSIYTIVTNQPLEITIDNHPMNLILCGMVMRHLKGYTILINNF